MSSRGRQHLGGRTEDIGLFSSPDDGPVRSILATLSFADALGMPLTAQQISERLIAPTRVGASGDGGLASVVHCLDTMVERGDIRAVDGWYLPAGASREGVVRHLDRLNIQAAKWRTMRSRAFWFQILPFVRAVFVAGSLAQGTTGPESDWDVFVVVRRGRLYTGRTFLLATAWLMRRLRTKRQPIAPDHFCFNHIITDDKMTLRHRSLFVANALASLMPLHDPDGLLMTLWQANRWVGEYLATWPARHPEPIRRTVRSSRVLAAVRRGSEALLSSFIVTALERSLRRWQQWRIEREPATHAKGGRIVADERELEFHPRSVERSVLNRYNSAMSSLGIPSDEHDSGLM